eukprot:TRINITY_DN1689_c0_g1_i2.p1 TRINITY_DN1689_c0_g1~~TRINITY_DN1689_c0_g1_i2.p1  ORF type:complete len:104 (+),score=17.41 TRINITY_DN1689_c0_g1_i2:460-771(+)
MEHNFDWTKIGSQIGMNPYEARQLYQRQCATLSTDKSSHVSTGTEEDQPEIITTSSYYPAPSSEAKTKVTKKMILEEDSEGSLSMSDLEDAFLDQHGSSDSLY